ncbi:MAG: RnfABCDGE type electron transport complex subunit G [Clostridiales bacterium]|nr:RnfABCDGE type electron transport complex subunit G [Clostridiales bacterium]
MKQITRPMIILGVICIVCAGLLGVAESVTREPIRVQNEATANAGKQKVFADAVSFEEIELADDENVDGTSVSSANVAVDASGEVLGYVVEVLPNGFGGSIDLMVGVDLDGVVTGISVLSHSESAGLGARATEDWFQEQFVGMTAPVAVAKDGGEVEAITSATITSRAVSTGVNAAIGWAVDYMGGAN